MILCPESLPLPEKSREATRCMPAWLAVGPRQQVQAGSYWLVAQPDHARLSGELAANFVAPKLEEAIVQGIGLHDAGWAIFEAETDPRTPPLVTASGKPRAFTEMPPEDFLRAWSRSIALAEQIAPVAGLMVSRHFRALGEFALTRQGMNGQLVRDFIARETEREERLRTATQRAPEQIEGDLHALQFCDLLSLYLCCGAQEEVEFPFDFGAGRVQVRHEDGCYRFSPPLFAGEVRLHVRARRWPGDEVREIEFVLR